MTMPSLLPVVSNREKNNSFFDVFSERMAHAVLIKNARKSYGQKEILKNFNMKVKRGTIYGLLGPSGCGKTTLLSCIVGRKKFDEGELWVVGGKPGAPESGVPGPRVGYMPQEIALIAEFTVKSAVFYFGRILQMPDELIETRFNKLKLLLDLPPDDRLIKECSGGQQRRVSFASAMVHEPELLILDEPTVGLDPLLRDRIWDYLVEITQKHNMAVIITTHYIEEARQANTIGLMREGRLLAEESPEYLLTTFQKDSLEDVFLALSQRQEDGALAEVFNNSNNVNCSNNSNSINHVNNANDFNIFNTLQTVNQNSNFRGPNGFHHTNSNASMVTVDIGSKEYLTSSKRSAQKKLQRMKSSLSIGEIKKSYNSKRTKALLIKNWMQYSRNISGVCWTLAFPIIQFLAFFNAIGTDIRNIELAVVNEENYNNLCHDYGKIKTIAFNNDSECVLNALSCRFLDELNDPMFTKKLFKNHLMATEAVEKGRAIGVLLLTRNFSKSFENRMNSGRSVTDQDLDFGEIKVWLDMSNRQIGAVLRQKLYLLYFDFQRKLMRDCNYPEKAGEIPIRFETPIYGSFSQEYLAFMIPGVIMSFLFFMGTTSTSTIIISERQEGIWDRSIVCGVTSVEIMLTHFITQFILIALQVAEALIITFVIYNTVYSGSFTVITVMSVLEGLCGMCYGFFISIISENHNAANIVATGSFVPMILVCGLLWPIEGQPAALRAVSRFTPFTIPGECFRNVMSRGWTIDDVEVYKGILVELAWIVGLSILNLFMMKRRR